MALKYYLAEREPSLASWFGLNRSDTLLRKLNHFTQKQFQFEKVSGHLIQERYAILKGQLYFPLKTGLTLLSPFQPGLISLVDLEDGPIIFPSKTTIVYSDRSGYARIRCKVRTGLYGGLKVYIILIMHLHSSLCTVYLPYSKPLIMFKNAI